MSKTFDVWADKEDLAQMTAERSAAHSAWEARQPEIDALRASVTELVAEIDRLKSLPPIPEFTVWWQRFLLDHEGWRFTCEEAALAAFSAHKSEIEVLKITLDTLGDTNKRVCAKNAALKAQVENYKEYADGVSIQLSQANKEFNALKAENDRARKAYLEYEQENFLLKAENERLRFYEERNREKNEQIAKLSSEIDRLRKDAERYRFQNAHNFRFFPDSDQWEVVGFRGDLLACGGAETYESAIDAAMKDFSTEES